MRLALFQPDIPQNLGAALRLGACLDVPVDVIEPCGFPLSDTGVRRAAMDYGALAQMVRHASWAEFLQRPERETFGRFRIRVGAARLPAIVLAPPRAGSRRSFPSTACRDPRPRRF